MAQVKIYGLNRHLKTVHNKLSDTIHTCIVEELSFPIEKKFHRFITFDQEMIIFPEDKSECYTIIEIMMIEGRKPETKKALIKRLFKEIAISVNIAPNDLEIVIIESPAVNWGFRGMCGDEITLSYKVDV